MTGDRLKGTKTLQVGGFLDEFAKDEVKGRVDILTLFASYGVTLEKKGKGYMGRCPFHDDTNPSLSVDPTKGLYHCFGCGESGDVVTLVQKTEGLSFQEAIARLKNGVPATRKVNGTKKKPSPDESPREPESPVTLEGICEHYQKALSTDSRARDYLAHRGLDDPDLIERFRLGVSTGSLGSMLSGLGKSTAKDFGVLTDRGREFFSGYLTVPLLDQSGRVVSMYGRALSNQAKVAHKYLPGPHQGLVNGKAAGVYEWIILTESILDALSLVKLDYQNVIPVYGAHGFTDDHLVCLKEQGVREVTIAFDSDDAGRAGAKDLSDRLQAEGFQVDTTFPQGAKDWNEVLTSRSPETETSPLITAPQPLTNDEPLPEAPTIRKEGGRHLMESCGLSYRILGAKELFGATLRVNIRLEVDGGTFLDNVDLYSARSRIAFSNHAAEVIGVDAGRIEKDLFFLVDHLEAERDRALRPSEPQSFVLSEEDKALGMDLLTDPDLFDRIASDATALGYVGETTNKILMYLAATSRKMADPVSVIVISESASGKSYLIDTIKKMVPPEEVVSMTSLSDQALNYLPEDGLLHKFLVMGEAVHGETIEHQVREMLSAKELSRLVTVKDPKTGELTARMVRKPVIVSAVMSTTDTSINPENASRSFVINTDESSEQTKAIHEAQRKKYSLERYRAKSDEIPKILRAHYAAGRLLEERVVVNPFADLIDFPHQAMRTRRDHERFMDLIAAVCFLRQFQKTERTEGGITFIEADLEDYRIAYQVMVKILPATLTAFPKSAGQLYDAMREVIRKKAKRESLEFSHTSVSQREIREQTSFSQMFVKRNMRTLVDYEYVMITGLSARGSRRGYRIPADESLNLVELSSIPTPEAMKLQFVQSGSVGQTGSGVGQTHFRQDKS